MASKWCVADGNFATGATWQNGATGTGSEQLATSSSTALTTSYVYCPVFTVTNGEIIDGVLACFRCNTATPGANTVTLALSDDNGVTATREKAIAVTDMFSTTLNSSTLLVWVFFKFDSTLTADGGSDYRVGLKCSAASTVTAYRGGTADWFRVLRTTTGGSAPSAGDHTVIAPEAPTSTRTLTMNENSTTAYGSMWVGKGGIVTWATGASTALRLAGNLWVSHDGDFRMGTVATPVPRAYTATLEFACGSDGQYVANIYGDWVSQGESRTSAKNQTWCLLDANAGNGATSLTVDRDTGWKSGDTVVVAPDGITYGGWHRTTLNGDAGATSLTLTAGLNAARTTTPTPTEIVNLSRNVRMWNTNTAYRTRFVCYDYSTVDADWTLFAGTAVASANAMPISGISAEFNYCAMDFGNGGATGANYIGLYAYTQGMSFAARYCVLVDGTGGYGVPLLYRPVATTAGSTTITDCVAIAASVNATAFSIGTSGNITGHTMTFARNRAAGGATGFYLAGSDVAGATHTISDCVAHSLAASAVALQGFVLGVTLSNVYGWGAGGTVYPICNIYGARNTDITLTNCTFKGWGNSALQLDGICYRVRASGCTFATDAMGTTTSAIRIHSTASTMVDLLLDNCALDGATQDFQFENPKLPAIIRCRDCTFDGPALVGGTQQDTVGNKISSSTVDNAHFTWLDCGLIERNTTTYRTASPSIKLTPSSVSTEKLESPTIKIPISSGVAPTISVYVRKNASYNGNAPRLIAKANPALGANFDTDAVLATFSGSADAWVLCSGTAATPASDGVLEACVDCDGTAGHCFADDWSVA